MSENGYPIPPTDSSFPQHKIAIWGAQFSDTPIHHIVGYIPMIYPYLSHDMISHYIIIYISQIYGYTYIYIYMGIPFFMVIIPIPIPIYPFNDT